MGGYDEEVKNRGNSYVIFDANQVKNVDNTTPTNNPDILKDTEYEYTSQKDKLHIERAEETFGYTDDFEKAGYLTWNGDLLDFSDGSDRRIEDHRAINQVFDENFDSNTEYLIKFMNEGNIRLSPETPGLEISSFTEPSNAQLDMIEEYADWNKHGGYFTVDFCDEKGYSIGSLEYEDNINPTQIVDDIKEFFRTGELPKVEETSKQYDNQITIEDTLRTDVFYKTENNKPVLVGQRYWNGFEKQGYIDLKGKVVRDAQDVAELAQIFRNPLYETARIIYTKGNTIVGQEAVSSYLPNASAMFTEKNKSKAFYKMEDRMKRLEADGYYLVHNHPSGTARASQQDIVLTKSVSNAVDGFKGHVIVDHGTYAYIFKGIGGDMDWLNGLQVSDKNALYKDATFETALKSDKVPWNDITINNRDELASLMHNLKNSPNYSNFILCDSQNKINAIIDIPNSFFNMRTEHVEGYIRNIAKQYGATKAFIGTTDAETFNRIKQLSNLQDAVLYKLNKNEFSNNNKGIFDNKEKGLTAVRTAEESKDERIERVRKYIEETQKSIGTLGAKVDRKNIVNRIMEEYGVTKKGNTTELEKASTEIQSLIESGKLTDKKIDDYAEHLINNLKVSVDDYYLENKELKKMLRTTKLYVSEAIKNGFGSWDDFRKNNMGVLRLTNDKSGLPVDTFYQELTDIYGEVFFPSDISNASDQLERMSEVSKQIKKIDVSLKRDITENFGEKAVEEMKASFAENLKTLRNKTTQENQKSSITDNLPPSNKIRSWTETVKENELVDKFLNIETMTYQVKSNAKTLERANSIIEINGYDGAMQYMDSVFTSGKFPTATDITLGERLIQEAIKNGEFEKAEELVSKVTIMGTELGQSVQALSIIQKMSPAGQLMHLQRSVERMNAKMQEDIKVKGTKNKRSKTNSQNIVENFADIISAKDELPSEIETNPMLKNLANKIADGEQAKLELPTILANNSEFNKAINEMARSNEPDNSKLLNIVDKVVKGEQTKMGLPKENFDNSNLLNIVDKVVKGEQTKIELKKEMKDNPKLNEMVTEIVEGEQDTIDGVATDASIKELKKFKGLEITPEMEIDILSARTPEQLEMAMTRVKEQLASQVPVSLAEKFDSFRYLAMLGNAKTHERNIIGNALMRVMYGEKNFIQRVLEVALNDKLEERTKTFEKSTEAVKAFAEAMVEENTGALLGSGYANIESEIKSMRKIFKNKVLQWASELNSKALETEDMWAKTPVFKSVLAEYLTANGIKTEQDIQQNAEIVQKGINYAVEEALKATFNQYNAVATAISRFENSSSMAKVLVGGIVPFKKTPLNIVKTAVQYNPIGLLETLTVETHKLKQGLISVNTYIERISQGLTGTSIALVGYFLASVGLLTGSTSEDDEYKESLGLFQPYSIHIPGTDTYMSISFLSPTAIPLLMGAEIYSATHKKGKKNTAKTIGEMGEVILQSLNPVSEMSMLSSLNEALINYGGDDAVSGISAFVSTALKSYVGQAFPTLGYQLNNFIDPTIRSTSVSKNSSFKTAESIARQALNKMPGASYLLEPSLDVWGNVRKRSDNAVLRGLNAFANPTTFSENTATEVDNEILNLYEQNGNSEIIPTSPQKYFTANSVKYEMSASEYTQFKMTYGQTAYEKLETLFKSNEYKNMSTEEKEEQITKTYRLAKDLAKYDYLATKFGDKGMEKMLDEKSLKKYNEAVSKAKIKNGKEYFIAYYAQLGVKGDKNGTTNQNKTKAIMKALPTLSKTQARKLAEIF